MAAEQGIHRTSAWLLALITLLALAVRVWALGSRALLPDEGSSLYFSQLSPSLLLWAHCDPHPPGYYLLLRGVAALGQSESWLRLPSALAGALAAPLTWAVGRTALRAAAEPGQRWPDQAALLAAALVACAPLAIWYSQEARPYALLATLALAMVWAGLRWRLRPGVPAALLFLVAGWWTLGIEYGGLLALLGLNLFLLSGWPWEDDAPQLGRRWLALQAILLAPFAAWWLLSAQRVALSQMSYQAIFLAVRAQALGLEWTPQQAARAGVVMGLALAGLGLALALATRRSAAVRRWLAGPWVAAGLWGLVLALALLGALPRLYTVKRHLNILLPYVSIAAAWALLHQRNASQRLSRPRRAIAFGAPGLLLVLSLAMGLAAPRPAWQPLIATLAGQMQPGDALWVDELDAAAFAYYWDAGSDGLAEQTGWRPLFAADLAVLNQTPATQRVWLAASATPYRDLRQTLPPAFASHRVATQSLSWDTLTLTAYDASAAPQPIVEPRLTLRWGLDIQSPLAVDCRR
jgi:4-amino-4-deoxy-L-arabinose transferase-like glycosyltransferase